MKRNILIIVLGISCIFSMYAFEKPAMSAKQSSLTVFDSAILVLKDFVTIGGDTRLGFGSAEEFDGAWIDTTMGLRVLYLKHDTMTTTNTRIDSELMALDRVIYPVFTKTFQGVTELRSAITFDSGGGWHPIIFQDSTIIAPYIRRLMRMRALDPSLTAEFVEIPQIENYAVVTHGKNGVSVLSTPSLHHSLGNDYPQITGDSTDEIPLGDSVFLDAVSHRLHQH